MDIFPGRSKSAFDCSGSVPGMSGAAVWCPGLTGQCSSVPREVQMSSGLCLEYPESVWGVTECYRRFLEYCGSMQ